MQTRLAQRMDRTMAALRRRYRDRAASDRATPWETVLFTMLTARTRDDMVEPVFRRLHRRYPGPGRLADADEAEVQKILSGIGLYRTKAKNAIALAKGVMERFGGTVPRDLDALQTLAGVGRKTASCVLVYAFGIPAIAVDTHVHRIVNRLGWVRERAPERTEAALRRVLPRKHWLEVNRVMVQFGRDICVPGVPRCPSCPVRAWCRYPKKTAEPRGK